MHGTKTLILFGVLYSLAMVPWSVFSETYTCQRIDGLVSLQEEPCEEGETGGLYHSSGTTQVIHWEDKDKNGGKSTGEGQKGTTEKGGKMAIQRAQDGHFYLDATLDGTPVHFLVDTGATKVTLSEATARKIGLKLSPGAISHTAGGLVPGYFAVVKELAIGGILLSGVDVIVLPEENDFVALLGMNVLSKFKIEYEDNVMHMAPL